MRDEAEGRSDDGGGGGGGGRPREIPQMPAFGGIAPRCGLRRSETSTLNERRNASHLRKPHTAAARSTHDGDDNDSWMPSLQHKQLASEETKSARRQHHPQHLRVGSNASREVARESEGGTVQAAATAAGVDNGAVDSSSGKYANVAASTAGETGQVSDGGLPQQKQRTKGPQPQQQPHNDGNDRTVLAPGLPIADPSVTSVLPETSTTGVAQARRLASFSRLPDSVSPGHRRVAAIMAAPWREPMSVTPVFGSSGEGSTLRGETTPDAALSCSASVATATAIANAINATATVSAAAGSDRGGAIVATEIKGYKIGGIMQSDSIVSGDGGNAGGWDPSLLEDEQLSSRKEDYGREEDGEGSGVPREDCPAVVRSDGGACIRPSSGRHDDAHNDCWEDTDYNSNSTWATNNNTSFSTRVSTGSFATTDSNTRGGGGGGGGGGSPRSRVLAATLGAAARQGVAAAGEEGVLGGESRLVFRCAKNQD
ncbi:unnamed protein product [Ectocarpus sp. CCAP 1310/34]|nr:unnamed protein product [Ectocarpus sp. CCAP 1310/34]